MTFLPIVDRELRVASRRKGTYVARCSAALLVFVLGAWFFLMMSYAPPATISKALFGFLSAIAILYGALVGPHFTADCLSQERRDGTLGLLFLTDLKGYDVVLGKLAATSLTAFYGLLAMLPILAIPLLIGGVSSAEVWRMSLIAINTMFFSLTAGLFVSSLAGSARQAMTYTTLLIAGFAGLLPLFGAWFAHTLYGSSASSEWWMFASPIWAYINAFDAPYLTNKGRYLGTMSIIHGLGWIFLIAACYIAPRNWQDKPVSVKVSFKTRLAAYGHGSGKARERYRKLLLDLNPYYWLTSRVRFKAGRVWLALIAGMVLWMVAWADQGSNWLDPGEFIFSALVTNAILKSWFASEASRQLCEDKLSGSLELLLSTPLSVDEILKGQRLSLQRQFIGPLMCVLGIYVLFMLASASRNSNTSDRELFTLLWLGGMLIFALDFVCLYWVGAWMAMFCKHPNRAFSATILLVMVLPWAAFLVLLLFGALGGGGPGTPEFTIPALWFFTAVGLDVLLIFLAQTQVTTNFRTLAASRFSR